MLVRAVAYVHLHSALRSIWLTLPVASRMRACCAGWRPSESRRSARSALPRYCSSLGLPPLDSDRHVHQRRRADQSSIYPVGHRLSLSLSEFEPRRICRCWLWERAGLAASC